MLTKARAGSRHLRIWSAACARGEEPATLAMLLADEPSLAGWTWTIVATDLDEEALAGARLGLYGERAVSQVPPLLLERWFKRRGKLFELDAGLRSRISYQSLNLAHAPFALPFAECDLVLMRNVLIYFRRPLQRWVISQVGKLLSPEGYLFLGASETLWQIQDELESVDLGPCFAYRHRRAPAPEARAEADRAAPGRCRPAPAPEKPAEERPRWSERDSRDWSAARGRRGGVPQAGAGGRLRHPRAAAGGCPRPRGEPYRGGRQGDRRRPGGRPLRARRPRSRRVPPRPLQAHRGGGRLLPGGPLSRSGPLPGPRPAGRLPAAAGQPRPRRAPVPRGAHPARQRPRKGPAPLRGPPPARPRAGAAAVPAGFEGEVSGGAWESSRHRLH